MTDEEMKQIGELLKKFGRIVQECGDKIIEICRPVEAKDLIYTPPNIEGEFFGPLVIIHPESVINIKET